MQCCMWLWWYILYLFPCIDEESWSEEEQDPVVLDQTWRGDPDSEDESLDSDHEDPLKWDIPQFYFTYLLCQI